MVLDAFFRRASEKFPIPMMLRVLLERVLQPERLDAWFEAVTEKQYTRELFFSSAFELMSVVVFKAFGSVHSAYQAKRTEAAITVSVTSVYNKLNGVEAQTSRALVRDTAAQLGQIVADVQGVCRPWLPGYRVKVLDGNCIEATEHRLKVLRTTAAGPRPGKALVVYDPAVEMAIDVFPCEDGHAQERALLGEVVPTIQAGDLWILDRNFCVPAASLCASSWTRLPAQLGRTPRSQSREALAARNSPRNRRAGPPPGLPRRVRLPLQPAPFGVSGPALPAATRTGGTGGPRNVPIARRESVGRSPASLPGAARRPLRSSSRHLLDSWREQPPALPHLDGYPTFS